eukprot:GHVN01084974.1.p2 GENE.GHVN01084974.1~~GHVN01084974.1.p2  ORF type:complete len:297 (+),score=23.28 GHVN01084974.1:1011-1901(+)
MLKRLFPFGRGITHSYWAGNMWALTSAADIVLAYLMGVPRNGLGVSSTAGLEGNSVYVILPQPTPTVCFLLSLALHLPLVYLVWCRNEPFARIGALLPGYVSMGCFISFLFGWHVHEKAILLTSIPLSVFAWSHDPSVIVGDNSDQKMTFGENMKIDSWFLNTLAAMSMFPLINTPQETLIRYMLCFFPMLVELWALTRWRHRHSLADTICQPSRDGATLEPTSLMPTHRKHPLQLKLVLRVGFLIVGLLVGIPSSFHLSAGHYPFLPLMLVSVHTAVGYIWIFLSLLQTMVVSLT